MTDRVLIVDDEPIIRKGLKGFIDWELHGLQLEGDCANGVEALELIQTKPIDILITDIKMPLMDGLQLTQKALQVNPDMKVVLISSYNEFDYVREGMKYGAVDYLLKPSLEAGELIIVLDRCKVMLQKQRQQVVERQIFSEHVHKLERKRLEQEIIRWLVTEQAKMRFTDIFGETTEAYVCAFGVLDGLEKWQELYGKLHISIIYEEIQACFYDQIPQGSAPILAGEGIFMIFPQEGDTELILEQLKSRIESDLHVSITLGFCVEQADEWLERGLKKSREASVRRFYEGAGKSFKWKDSTSYTFKPSPESIPLHRILDMIREARDTATVLECFVSRWKKRKNPPDQVKNEAYELLSALAYSFGDAKLLADTRDRILHSETLDGLIETINGLVDEMKHPGFLVSTDRGQGGQLINNAIDYIKSRFTDELTLQEVADFIHVSKSYFSNLFKKHTGQNFIDYVIDLRLHEAKRLLLMKEYKIYEVAEKSGFNDVKYFSRLFKKITQMTPVEYRDKHDRKV
ncbi:response regulator [Paenibacillus sp. FSL W8-0194]|uniref:response regulator transcription factor n=1 Tax=Paenibacillus sp. FSL W8-0194 TaxID=2921711 RepID=UPI0030DA6594